jgi:O-antigen ligase
MDMRRAALPATAILIAAPVLLVCATPAQAYIGPGGAVSALGALLALIAAIVIALFGFLWFPIKRLLRRRRAANPAPGDADHAAAPAEDEPDAR